MSIKDFVRYRWDIVAAAFMVHVIADGVLFTLGVFYIEFLDEFQQGKGETAWVTSLIPGTFLTFGPLSGALTQRYGSRIVTMIGGIIAASAFIISSFATSIYYLCCSLGFLTGVGYSCVFLPAIVSVGQNFEGKRPIAIGIAVSGAGIGTFIFAPIVRIMIDEYGWRGALLIEAAILLNLVVCGTFFKPATVPVNKMVSTKECEIPIDENALNVTDVLLDDKNEISINHIEDNETTIITSNEIKIVSKKSNSFKNDFIGSKIRAVLNNFDFALLKERVFVIFIISNFITSFGFNAPYIYLPDRSEESGVTREDSAFLISVIGISNTVGRIVFGWVANQDCVNRLILYCSALIICGTVNILNPFYDSKAYLMCYSAIYGLFIGVFISLNSVILVDLLGINRLNKALGLLMLFQGFATFIGPPTFGWLYDATGSYTIPFYVVGALGVFGGVIMLPMYRHIKKGPASK